MSKYKSLQFLLVLSIFVVAQSQESASILRKHLSSEDAITQTIQTNIIKNQNGQTKKKLRSNFLEGVIAVGGSVNIVDVDKAEIYLVIVLEDKWDTFGFPPSKGFEIANRLKFKVPGGTSLSGAPEVISPKITDSKYFGLKQKVSRYSGVIKIKQDLSLPKSVKDFSKFSVSGALYCQAHRQEPANSLATTTPFVLFFKNPLGIANITATATAPKPNGAGPKNPDD